MASKYLVTITRVGGEPVHLVPGGTAERDLRKELLVRVAKRNFKQRVLDQVAARGVGIARTTAHVVSDVSDALDHCDLLNDIAKSLDDLIHEMKSEVLPK